MSDDIVDIAELLVSELITNALVHGAGDPELVLTVDPPRIRVEVRDADPTVDFGPVVGEASRTHGRGLAIVDALATSWGVEPRWDGKAVWFVLEF
jgi:anti-sigma regulatory factor (Ser/Thr protein kinase)